MTPTVRRRADGARTFGARALSALLATAVAATMSACGDDDGPSSNNGGGPTIAGVRLSVQRAGGGPALVVTVDANSAGGAPIVLNSGATYELSAQPVDAQNQVVPNATLYELRMRDLPAGLAFTGSGGPTARLVATSTASAKTVQAEMYYTLSGSTAYTATFPIRVDP